MTEPLLFILAMDQRDSIEQKLYDLDSAPSPEESASIAANKLLVYRGLLDAVPALPDGVQARVPRRRAVRRLARRARRRPTTASASRCRSRRAARTGSTSRTGTTGATHAEFFGADHPKVLIHDNPGLDEHAARGAGGEGRRDLLLGAAGGPGVHRRAARAGATDDDLAKVGRRHRPLRPRDPPGPDRAGDRVPAGPRRRAGDLEDRGARRSARTPSASRRPPAAAAATGAASCSAGTRRRSSWTSGCGSPRRSRASSASRSAAATGGTRWRARIDGLARRGRASASRSPRTTRTSSQTYLAARG